MSNIGEGAKLEYESGSDWVEVPNVKSVGFPGVSVGAVETTHLGSGNAAREHMAGWIEPNMIAFEASFSEAEYALLYAMLVGRETRGWRVTGPTGDEGVMTCDGFLTKCDVAFNTDDSEQMISGEVKLTGQPALT